jgi:hypothetical protein
MSMFFRYKGYLSFADEAQAARYYGILTTGNNSWFSFAPEELELVGATIRFKADGNYNSYSSCEDTKDLLYEAARNAVEGEIEVDEGDSEDNLWNLESIPAKGGK